MNNYLPSAITGFCTIMVAVIGWLVSRQATKAKVREEQAAALGDRDRALNARVDAEVARLDGRVNKLLKEIGRLQDEWQSERERAIAAEEGRIRAERERDDALDRVRDGEQIIEALIKDRLDLDVWVTDGGKPPVPGPNWRVVQILESRQGGNTKEVSNE